MNQSNNEKPCQRFRFCEQTLTQVILQHGTSFALRPTPSVLIKDPTVPLVVDRDGFGRASCDVAWLSTCVGNCRIRDTTGSRCVTTLNAQAGRKEG